MSRDKITVSLDREIIKWIENAVSNKIFYNKSHAIEFCLEYIKKHNKLPLNID